MKFLEINCFEFAKASFRPAAVISDQCCDRNAALHLQGNDTGCGVQDFFYFALRREGERIQGGHQRPSFISEPESLAFPAGSFSRPGNRTPNT